METTSIFILFGILTAITGFIFYLKTLPIIPSEPKEENDENISFQNANQLSSPEKADLKTTFYESFDINGTKILRIDGVYTVFEEGGPKVYQGPQQLPAHYRELLLDMQNRRNSSDSSDYFLENDNGNYFVRFPNGKKRKYKNYESIPEDIKKHFARA